MILPGAEQSIAYDSNAVPVASQDRKHQAGARPKDIAALMAPTMDAAHTSRKAGCVLKAFSVANGASD